MFNFMSMALDRDDRKVTKYESDGLTIDTCAVTDSTMPYETAISHLLYNNGNWIIVETYPNLDDAKIGHEKWIKTMTASELPPELRDVSEIVLATMLDDVSENDWRVYKKGE